MTQLNQNPWGARRCMHSGSDIPKTPNVHEAPENGLAHDALYSAAYAAFQQPVTGLTQAIDKVAGTELQAQTLFMEAPTEAEFGSARWHVQTLGSAAGGLLPLLAVGKVVKSQMAAGAVEAQGSLLSRRAAIGLTLKESAATGFLHDALLRPTAEGGNFWTERLSSGVGGALTFSAMTATSLGLAGASESGFAKALSLGKTMRSPVVSGVISGIPGGAVSAEYESLVHDGRGATAKELAHSVYSMSLIGGGFGLQHQVFGAKPKIHQEILLNANLAKVEPTLTEVTKTQTAQQTQPALEAARTDAPETMRAEVPETTEGATTSKITTDYFSRIPDLKGLMEGLRTKEDPFTFERHEFGKAHRPFEFDNLREFRDIRQESATEKAAKDLKYGIAKVLLEGLEQSKAAQATGTSVEGTAVERTVPPGELQMSLIEAQAIHDLKARSEKDANRLVELLGERGPLEARVAGQILRSTYCQFFPLDASALSSQFSQAQRYVSARDVLSQLEAGAKEVDVPATLAETKAPDEVRTATAPEAVSAAPVSEPAVRNSPITVTEAQALRTFQAQSAYEQHSLATILENRGPVAKWVAEQLQADYRDYIKSGGVPEGGEVGNKFLISYANIAGRVKEVVIDQTYLNSLTQRGERVIEAEQIYKDLSRARTEQRNFNPNEPLSLAEATALSTFAKEASSRWQVQHYADMLAARGPVAQYLNQKIAGYALRSPHDVIILEHGRRGTGYPTEVTPQWLAETTARGREFVAALNVVAKVEKAAKLQEQPAKLQEQPAKMQEQPAVADSAKSPISLEEANAIRILRNESHEQSKPLLNLLADRGAAAEYVSSALNRVSNEPITQPALDALVVKAQPYVDARNVLTQVEQGKVVGSKTEKTAITVEEANAILTLSSGPGGKETQLIAALAKRGSCAEFVAEKIKSERYSFTANEGRISEAALEKLTQIGDRYAAATQLFDRVVENAANAENATNAARSESLTVEEADAVATLSRYKSTQDATKLSEVLGQRSEQAKWVADFISKNSHIFQDGVNADALASVNRAFEIQKVLDSRSPELVRDYRLSAYKLAIEPGVSGGVEAARFVDVLAKMDPPRDQTRWNQNPHHPTVKEIASWDAGPMLPDWSVGAVHDHVRHSGLSYKSHSVEQLTLAAQGWQAEPTLPFAMAAEIGALSPQKRLAAGLAWRETLSAKGINNTGEVARKPVEPELEAAFREHFARVSEESRAAVIGRLTAADWRSLPLAIEALHGRGLSAEGKNALHTALSRDAAEPFKVLTGLKGAHFESAYRKISEGQDSKIKGTEHGKYTAGSTALKLALTFKGGWENWLNAQKNLGRSEHDATFWLQTVPTADQTGLGQMLLHNAGRNVSQLELIARRWSEVPPELRDTSFKDILEHLLTNNYQNVVSKEFAVEAGAVGMSANTYKERETRYLASQTVPVPFPLDIVWQSGELRGRFIPRSDARGLFLGQHTNSCQHPDGAARSSAWYGQESPKSGFFVVENRHGEIVAESWTWIADNNGVTFDNVEAKGIGQRTEDVRKIYQQAANELAKSHHAVTLGTGHGDLDVTGWREAGDKSLKLPSDYSGYTDANNQVILAENGAIKPTVAKSEVTVRGALNSDMDALQKISMARYPSGWQHVPIEADTRGLVIEEPGKGVIGYALIEPANRYISDIAVAPDANVHKTMSLIRSVSELVKQVGGEWSADCRDSTSYKLMKNMERRGKIKILKDEVTNRMGTDDMHHVVFVPIQ